MAGRDDPALLVALPHGMGVSGVSLWAGRLANGLARRGWTVGALVHDVPAARAAVPWRWDPRVRLFPVAGLAPLERCNGDLSPYLPLYRDALLELAGAASGPVVASPNLAADCYGVFAALSQSHPEALRVVGWLHNDTAYDLLTLSRYSPLVSRFVAVSQQLRSALAEALPTRAAEIDRVPYGVPVPEEPTTKPPPQGRPLELLYTGRIDHDQKRVGALLTMSQRLSAQGVAHRLTLVGDGPAREEIDGRLAGMPQARRLAPAGPARIAQLLRAADLFVLPSRFEGLSVSMLEALAAGCPPVVARAVSGAAEAVEHGETGALVDVAPEADERAAGEAFAEAVAALSRAPRRIAAMSRACQERARARFSLEAHLDAVERTLRACVAAPARPWPAWLPCAFTAPSTSRGAGSVPDDAGARFAQRLERIARKRPEARVALWGAGRHTIALAAQIASSPVPVVAVLDDDPAQRGRVLWGYRVRPSSDAAATGATDVVVSSWMHEERMWQRRGALESQGLRVHRLYADAQTSRPSGQIEPSLAQPSSAATTSQAPPSVASPA